MIASLFGRNCIAYTLSAVVLSKVKLNVSEYSMLMEG